MIFHNAFVATVKERATAHAGLRALGGVSGRFPMASPAKPKAKGRPKPGSGAPTQLQKAAGSGGLVSIASMLGLRNPELLKVVNPKARAKPAQPEAEGPAP